MIDRRAPHRYRAAIDIPLGPAKGQKMENFVDLFLVWGRAFGALIVLYGAYLAFDRHFRTSVAQTREPKSVRMK